MPHFISIVKKHVGEKMTEAYPRSPTESLQSLRGHLDTL